ncbi:MAG: hypothetical protein M1814_004034 [Vezdaea aestivalis]|nr:MAG: hypothetical protein M1814_004034 [Vezdaea aestivalis]
MSVLDPIDCSICLEPIHGQAILQPCGHQHFDLSCILIWLRFHQSCPLCKADVKNIQHTSDQQGHVNFEKEAVKDILEQQLAKQITSCVSSADSGFTSLGLSSSSQRIVLDEAVKRRRDVYLHKMYSMHVGSNPISGYREFSYRNFRGDSDFVRKAKQWIRRELKVFTFLDSAEIGNPSSQAQSSNSEFLLSYIVAILKIVDIRGSDGRAEDLISDYLGREDSNIFCHELSSYLRSPFLSPEEWDSHIQYGSSLDQNFSSTLNHRALGKLGLKSQ